jgi:hypothetical protein
MTTISLHSIILQHIDCSILLDMQRRRYKSHRALEAAMTNLHSNTKLIEKLQVISHHYFHFNIYASSAAAPPADKAISDYNDLQFLLCI